MPDMDSSRVTTTFCYIAEASRQLGVSPEYLRTLERNGRILPPRRDLNGRVYTPLDITLLRSMGVGSRPRKLKRAEEVLQAAR
jgi:hypothetical protein